MREGLRERTREGWSEGCKGREGGEVRGKDREK
jgi:hypothetical protein